MYRKYIKRLIDVIISGTLLLLFSPVFILITIVLSYRYKGTPFFRQLRPGLNEEIFSVFKFKTMSDERDENGVLLPDSLRLTPAGKFLRRTSLDELPQLVNVLRGDMSLIGPRPLLPRYLPYYRDSEAVRHLIRPGITGWAQVNGRNVSTWDERLAADIYYFNNLSFKLDVLIVYKTIKSVLSAKDVVIDPDSLMSPLDIHRKEYRERTNNTEITAH